MIRINENGYVYINGDQVTRINNKNYDYNGKYYSYTSKFPHTNITLFMEGKIVAIVKTSLSPFCFSSFLIYDNREYKLRHKIFSRKYFIHDMNNKIIGSIIPDGLMSMSALTTILDEIPIEVQIFISAYMQEFWRQQGGSA